MSPLRLTAITLFLLTMLVVCSSAQIWAQSPFPDGIRFADNGTVIRAGQNYTIVAQVLLGGGDYPKGNIGVYLETDNASVINLPETAMAVTNQNGTAAYNLTADQVKPGTAKVTAILLDKRTGARTSKSYTIARIGNLTGTVSDMGGVPVEGASVTLYQSVNGTMQVFPATGNPSVTASNSTGAPGSFEFTGIPYGDYYVEAGIAGKTTGVNYTFNDLSQPVYILMGGYSVATPTPLPTPTAAPSAQATATPAPTPTPASQSDNSKQVIWIGGLAVILAVIIIAIVVLTRKK